MATECAAADAAGVAFLATENVVRIGMDRLPDRLLRWLPCATSQIGNAEERFPHRIAWREPVHSSLCCLPNRTGAADRCFRGVYDEHIDGYERRFEPKQRVRMRMSVKRAQGEQGWQLGRVSRSQPLLVRQTSGSGREPASGWDEVRPIDERDDSFDERLIEQTRLLLVRELGLRDDLLQRSVHKRQAIEPTAPSTQRNAWHADYHESAWAHFAAILYLSAPVAQAADAEESTGWTGFADDCHGAASDGAERSPQPCGLERLRNGTAMLTRGWMVAPRPGRLVIFTTGAENYHAPLPVGIADSRRRSLQMWFRCRC